MSKAHEHKWGKVEVEGTADGVRTANKCKCGAILTAYYFQSYAIVKEKNGEERLVA